MSEKVKIEIGQKFPLTIKRLGINGEGVGFFKRNVVFVKGALPGEVVTAKVSKIHRKFCRGGNCTNQRSFKKPDQSSLRYL